MNHIARAASVGALFLVSALATVPNAGCGATGSKRFSFAASAAGALRDDGAPGGPLTFDNETGWTVKLTKANVTLGPVYLNVVSPLRTWLDIGSWTKTAHAHGDSHLDSGRVVGEVLGQVTFDALSPTEVAFPVRGTLTEEEVRTLDVWFYPPPDVPSETTKIETIALDIAGEATKGTDDVRFRGALVLNADWLPNAAPGQTGVQTITSVRQLRGVPAGFFPTEGGRLTLRFDVRRALRGADFSSLAASEEDPDGTKILSQAKSGKHPIDQVMTNLGQGLGATASYSVTWAP